MSITQPIGLVRIRDEEFSSLTGYLQTNFGIDLSKKRELVEGRLNNYILHKGLTDYKSYLHLLYSDKTGQEVSNVINYLTTNYSYFMREWESMRFFRDEILPDLKAKNRDRDLRIWSAGCSTGEEPYTLAMLMDDFFDRERGLWDKKVLATDISQKVLSKAEQGCYDSAAMEEVPMDWKRKFFDVQPDHTYRVKPNLMKEVLFRRFNLAEEIFPFKKKFHVIFCRNVMIYFNAQTKSALVDKFYNVTEPGGYLIIGQSESIDKSRTTYRYIRPSIFKRGE